MDLKFSYILAIQIPIIKLIANNSRWNCLYYMQYTITIKSMNIDKVNEEITLEQTRVQNCVLSQNDPSMSFNKYTTHVLWLFSFIFTKS